MKTQVKFKADYGTLWIKADVVEKVKGGYILDCGDTKGFFMRDSHAFNEDYYIIGTYQAKQWLGDMAFDVIETIKDYEQSNFGEVFTDFSEPERVVNMYVYIVGEWILPEAMEEAGVLDVEVTA